MLFSSPAFFLFFACYFALHIVLPLHFRLALIILGSLLFYGYWNPAYLWLPFTITFIAYRGVLWIMSVPEGKPRKRALAIVIIALLSPLVIVKYTNFIYRDVLGLALGFTGTLVQWELPLGVSFITFTLIAYVVDVYHGRYRLEKNPLMLGGLVLFFPHLIAGPILRPAELLPQLHRQGRHFRVRTVFGIAIFTIGLLKKICIADPLGEYVTYVFSNDTAALSGMDYLLAIYGFSLQIYCDFSGYTDMAIGAALMLGVRLPANFERPYVAISVVDFWKRWHITLSRWLRDYLYIPLGGNRLGFRRRIGNIFLTMGLGGLWHGASWTFVLWGIAHAIGISFSHGLAKIPLLRSLARLPKWIKVLVTFHFITATWILFRAGNLETAIRVALGPFAAPWTGLGAWLSTHVFPIFLTLVFFILHRFDSHQTIRKGVHFLPAALLWIAILSIWVLCIAFSQGSSAKFIYFDF